MGVAVACAPRGATQAFGPTASESMCRVDVRNGGDIAVEASYNQGSNVPIGYLEPSQTGSFPVPCERGRVSVSGVAPFGASMDRGRRWGSEEVELVPGEVVQVVLRPMGG